MSDTELDDPRRINELRDRIRSKVGLRLWYEEVYRRYAEAIARTGCRGVILELGSGGGFAKEIIPDLVTSDLLPYEGVDRTVDATRMDFPDHSLRAICMLNVFHHIPDVKAFLREAERCLAPGGRMLICDHHPGVLGRFIYRYLHHEAFFPRSKDWSFETTGPLSGANTALAWIVFQRDRALLKDVAPRLRLDRYETHSPLRYWLSGGLKNWTLLPTSGVFKIATRLDQAIVRANWDLGTYCYVEIEKPLLLAA